MKTLIQVILLLIANGISYFAMAEEESSDATNSQSMAAETEQEKTEQVEPQHHLPNIANKRASSLLGHMSLMDREEEVIHLSNASEDFYGLYLPQASGQPQGAVLILHDEQQHGHWPEMVAPLREYLPQFGWSTLTIELPDKLKRQRISREAPSDNSLATDEKSDKSSEALASETAETDATETDTIETESSEAKDSSGPEEIVADNLEAATAEVEKADENEPALPRLDKLPELAIIAEKQQAQEADSIDAIADYQSQNRQRIHSAIDYLHQQNQFNLAIIGIGRGASWAIDYVHQQFQLEEEPKGLSLITIDALPNLYDKKLVHQQLADISLPYLDLLQNKKLIISKFSQKRLTIMQRNNNPHYQQIITQEIGSYHEAENPSNRRIRGWLKNNAGGTQIPIKPKR